MLEPNDTLDGTYPFAPRFSRAPGFAMHYVDDGADDPILCLRGEPAWSYLYREIVPRLAARHRVIAPDDMIAIFEAQFPGAPVHRLADAGHFLQEDAPETIALLVAQFIALTPREG